MVDNTERVQHIITALERYGLKWKPGKTKARCNSPLRPGSNSLAFSIEIKDSAPGGGVFYDHVSKEGGNFVELEQLLPGFVAPSKSAPAVKVSAITAYEGLRDYAQAQGVPERVLSAAGWRVGEYFCPAHGRKRRAILFDTKTGTRARFIDGLKPKYMSPSGYRRCWYRLDEALHIAETTGQPLIICNGEASTLVAQYYGVAATAITGGGENDIPAELLEELRATYRGPITISLDSDDAGRTSSAKMLATLRGVDYEVRAVDLNGEKGFDLANFAKLHQLDTPAALQALKDLPEAQPEASSIEVLRLRAEIGRLRAENEHLRETMAEQRRELETLKAEQRVQTDFFQRRDISATEKIVILAARREIAVQAVHAPTPEALRRVSQHTLVEHTGTSDDTVRKCIHKFKGALWERHEVKARDEETGQPRTIIQLAPLPELAELRDFQPPTPRKHGGNHPKKACGNDS
jgi:hypothetical protein